VRECRDSCGPTYQDVVSSSNEAELGQVSCNGSTASAERLPSTLSAESGTRSPCKRHLKDAEQRFNPTLEALGCICRALLALGRESCCSTSRRTSLEAKGPGRLTRTNSKRGITKAGSRKATQSNSRLPFQCTESTCCPTAPSVAVAGTGCSKGCCAEKACQVQAPCAVDRNKADFPVQIIPGATLDLEKGVSKGARIILSVQGMTCTGCETKLSKSLANVAGISNIKTSLVLSRAEFDLDQRVTSAEDAAAMLKRMTGFECQRISTKGLDLDVVALSDGIDLLLQPHPPGILDMSRIGKDTVRITYDASVVGARDVVTAAFGRPLSLAPPPGDPSINAGSKHVRHVAFMTILSACLTIPVLVLEWAPLPSNEILYSSVSLAFATVIQVVIAGPFYPAALKSLIFARVIEMDLLIVLSTSSAYIFSVVAFVFLVRGSPLSTGSFFETSTLLVTLIMLGRFVSALARQKAVESISIRCLQQNTALLVKEDGRQTKEIDARLMQYGDVFRVPPDSRIVTDGTVLSGASDVDESMITGESVPVEKRTGSAVIAGSLNGSGPLTIRVTHLPGDNTISTIANMVDEAKTSKIKTQEIADTVAGYFVPVVVVLAIITFVTWIGVGIVVRHQSASEAAIQATTYAVAVLIISCPCAIGLAVPMVIVIAGGVAADNGVIFKTGQTIETARLVSHVVFDKTGTLTEGKLTVIHEKYPTGTTPEILAGILGLLADVKHPVAAAVAGHLKERDVKPATVSESKSMPGKGVEGRFRGLRIQAGNSRWLNLDSSEEVVALQGEGLSVFCVVIDGHLQALFALRDTPRDTAREVITSLKLKGISVSLVSGDDAGAVAAIASELGIPASHIMSRCSPAEKAQYVAGLLAQNGKNSKKNTVMFVGDGTNDAVALASASIGVHMNTGTDVARSAADAVLVRPDLKGILVLRSLSAAVSRRIAFNFSWAFVYNTAAILFAAGAFVNTRIPPAYAGVGEIVSVLPVIAIAVQLRWARLEE
jgi:Cd2+-exporting ATPase